MPAPRAPRLKSLSACSICLSSLRISASDGAPGEISDCDALRRGAAGAAAGVGASFAPRVPAGSGKLWFSSGSRVRTTPCAVAAGLGAPATFADA